MMIYTYTETDCTPSGLRSSYGDVEAGLSRTPCVTNVSGQRRIEGWCGTTNGNSVHAHGAVSLDQPDEDVEAAIRAAFAGCDVTLGDIDIEDIREWARGEDSECAENDYKLELDGSRESEGMTWNPLTTDGEGFYPEPRDGWVMAAIDDGHNGLLDQDGEPIDIDAERHWNAIEDALDAAGIAYDSQSEYHEDCGGVSEWFAICVREADAERARAAIYITALRSSDVEDEVGGLEFRGETGRVLVTGESAVIRRFTAAMERVQRRCRMVDGATVLVTDGPVENVMGDWEDAIAGVEAV